MDHGLVDPWLSAKGYSNSQLSNIFASIRKNIRVGNEFCPVCAPSPHFRLFTDYSPLQLH